MLRFAVNPSNDLSIADLRLAIFNHLLSTQLNEDLIIRIEDTNKETTIEGKDKETLDVLNLFSINHKNVVYQSEAVKYHQRMAMQLLSKKKAFVCFCSEDKINELKQEAKQQNKDYRYDDFCESLSDELVLNTNAPFCIRIKKPSNSSRLDSFKILDQNKIPTSDYANAADDMISNISKIITSEDKKLNISKQKHIRKSLGYDQEIETIYIKDIQNGEISVKKLIDDGFLPSAIANYLVLLGSNKTKEIFTLEEAQEWFDIQEFTKEELQFDLEKLKEINKKHIEELDNLRLSKILGFADSDIGKLAKLFLEDSTTINEIKQKVQTIFDTKKENDELKNEVSLVVSTLKKSSYIDKYEDLEKYLKEETKLNENDLYKALQYVLLKDSKGPALNKVYPLIKNYLGEIVK